MKRRSFLQLAAAGALGQGLLSGAPLHAADTAPERDRFGGWTGKKFKPTGFFRVEKDDRWWLVTRRLRNLGADAPGKAAYVRTMRDLYRGEIHDSNATYGTTFDSFNAIATTENWRPATDLSNANETRDNVVFLQAVVAKYYETARDAIHRYDPNHVFFGDKINANTDSVDTILTVTSKYTDVVFYQMYARYEVQKPGLDRWAKIADMPIINGDSS